jgi:hypothetical protein
MPAPENAREIAGLRGVSAQPLARVPIRTRSASVTVSAWRLEVTSDQGPGTIVLVEPASGESHYRGDGIFLGWGQERLAEVYAALRARDEEGGLDTPQLG